MNAHPDIAAVEIAAFLRSIDHASLDHTHFIARFDEFVQELKGHRAVGRSTFIEYWEWMRYSLTDGEVVFGTLRCELNSWMERTFVVERVLKRDHQFVKALVKISAHIQQSDERARYQLLGTPSIICFKNIVQIEDCVEGEANFPFHEVCMREEELGEFFANKQRILDEIKICEKASRQQLQALESAIEEDKRVMKEVFSSVIQEAGIFNSEINRQTHPFVRPILHVLPRLIATTQEDITPLKMVSRNLSVIAQMGFSTLMLGVVDKQTTNLYYGETEDGKLIPYVNNHGYWSSGELGIDPMLGIEEDYIQLVHTGQALGITVMQDIVLASLGYPAQIARLASDSLSDPTISVMLNEHEVSICDADRFLHAICIPEEDRLDGEIDADEYAAIMAQSHIGALYALPKPNLYNEHVLQPLLARSNWQIRQAGVNAFRLDMAKHIGVPQLRSIISTLREECNKKYAQGLAQQPPFTILLEYWTTRYRDLKFAMKAIEGEATGAYFYDFPLAQALHDILINNRDVHQTLQYLLDQRQQWGINLFQLIPTFIDHDFSFRPIYNGDYSTRAMVVIGYALSALLSCNSPYVYFAYDKSNSGVPSGEEFSAFNETFSRKVASSIFATSDPVSPSDPVAHLFRVLEDDLCMADWLNSGIELHGDFCSATIRRRFIDKDNEITIEAHFSQFYQPDLSFMDPSIVFSYCHGPSVIIKKFCRQLDADSSIEWKMGEYH